MKQILLTTGLLGIALQAALGAVVPLSGAGQITITGQAQDSTGSDSISDSQTGPDLGDFAGVLTGSAAVNNAEATLEAAETVTITTPPGQLSVFFQTTNRATTAVEASDPQASAVGESTGSLFLDFQVTGSTAPYNITGDIVDLSNREDGMPDVFVFLRDITGGLPGTDVFFFQNPVPFLDSGALPPGLYRLGGGVFLRSEIDASEGMGVIQDTDRAQINYTFMAVPDPTTLALLALALAWGRRRT